MCVILLGGLKWYGFFLKLFVFGIFDKWKFDVVGILLFWCCVCFNYLVFLIVCLLLDYLDCKNICFGVLFVWVRGLFCGFF